jgi:hypothetical protein
MRFRVTLVGAAVAVLAFPSVVFGANPDARLATLDGASEVPPVATAATGSGWVVVSSDGSTITYHIEYSGLSGAVTASHIHTGAPGVAGGIIFPLTPGPSPMDGTLTSANFTPSGSITTYAEALTAIRNNATYFNLHTAANPGGEIRGNLVTTAAAFEATLNGAQEVPAVATAGTGNGFVVFSADDSTIWYRITFSGLSDVVTAAHIHTGATGVAGGIILPLVPGASPMFGALTSANFTPSGAITTYAQAVAAIKAGNTYFNLHTTAHPGGEVRGQIGAAAVAPTAGPTAPVTSTPGEPAGEVGVDGVVVALLVLFGILAVTAALGRRLAPRRGR